MGGCVVVCGRSAVARGERCHLRKSAAAATMGRGHGLVMNTRDVISLLVHRAAAMCQRRAPPYAVPSCATDQVSRAAECPIGSSALGAPAVAGAEAPVRVQLQLHLPELPVPYLFLP